jgi:Do/DeqQ family serine protease
MSARRFPNLLVAALAALVLGLVLSGSIRITPRSEATSNGAPVSSAPPAEAPASAAAAPAVAAPNLSKSLTIPSFADIAAAALPGVVSITSTGVATESAQEQPPFGDPFEFFFGPRGRRGPQGQPRQRRQVAAGSGFLISDTGWVLTNNHVVAGASKIQVTLTNREVYTAKLVGTDPAIDVALLKVDAGKKLPALALGDSERTRVGDPVMAIGNPLRFAGTVTVGVLSAKGRRGISDDPTTASIQDLLQTDAAINFGNSGGPLLNAGAEVIGINTAMIQPAQNIGFAVAINSVKQILPQLEKSGKVERGMLGVRIGPVDQDIEQAFKLPSLDGAFVESVDAGKPADRAGIKPGDTIVQVEDTAVQEPRDLINRVSAMPPGSRVNLTLVREGRRMTVTATLAKFEIAGAEEPERESGGSGPEAARGERLGISLAELSAGVRQEIGARGDVRGVVVTNVRDGSPAGDQGLAPGDVITEINGTPVTSISQFRSELSKIKSGDYVKLYVRRFEPQEISRFVIIKTG